MAIKKVTENWQKRTVEETAGERIAVRLFDVDFDNRDKPEARPILALNAVTSECSVPQQGAQHPFDRGMYLARKSVETAEGAFRYQVTCSYSTLTLGELENPLREKPQIHWTFVTTDEPVDKDINGKAILNSALEPFDPPITKPVHDLALQYTRNERRYNQMTALKYKGKINSNTFLDAPPGTVMCTVFDADKIYDEKYGDYYRVTYEFQFRLEEVGGKKWGWRRRILDAGFRELVEIADTTGEPHWENIKDEDGNPVSQPVPLDGDGMKLHPTGKWPPDGYFLEFELHEKVSFSPLNIKV